jgi:uncharacterized protein YkwD
MFRSSRMWLRTSAQTVAVVVLFALMLAPSAQAEPVVFEVVNSRGVAQVAYVEKWVDVPPFCPGLSCWGAETDGYGVAMVDAYPGDRLRFRRGDVVGGTGAPPEGAGVEYIVGSPVPAQVRITVPALPAAPAGAGLTGDERRLLGSINAERAKNGRAALSFSMTLNQSADAYAHYLASTGQLTHSALATPVVRAIDAGWPVLPSDKQVAEVLSSATTAYDAFKWWMDSPSHRAILLKSNVATIGLGSSTKRWVGVLSTCESDAVERCRLTTDYGGPALTAPPPSPSAGGKPSDATARSARARWAKPARRHGRRLAGSVRLVAGSGRLTFLIQRSGRRPLARGTVARRGRTYRYSVRVPRRGRWRIIVRFAGADGWRDSPRLLQSRWIRMPPPQHAG